MPVKRTPDDRFAREVATGTLLIASGANLSNVLTLHDKVLMGLHVPSGIAGSIFTFQAADPAGAFNLVYDDGGSEVQVVFGAERAVGIDLTGALASFRELRVRTGPTGSLNAQAGNMVIGWDAKA